MSDEKVTIEVPLEWAVWRAGERYPSEVNKACRKAVEEHEAQQREAERKQLEDWRAYRDWRAYTTGYDWRISLPDADTGARKAPSTLTELQAKTMAAGPEAFEALEAVQEWWRLHALRCGFGEKAGPLVQRALEKRRTGK